MLYDLPPPPKKKKTPGAGWARHLKNLLFVQNGFSFPQVLEVKGSNKTSLQTTTLDVSQKNSGVSPPTSSMD